MLSHRGLPVLFFIITGAGLPTTAAPGLQLRYAGEGWTGVVTAGPTSPNLAVPPGARVDWAGLYWGASGDECAPLASVRLAVGTSAPVPVPASSTSDVATAYQSFADITRLVRPQPTQLALADACVDGWRAVAVYSFRDGPHKTYAPKYRAVRVTDGAVLGAGQLELSPGSTVALLGDATGALGDTPLRPGDGYRTLAGTGTTLSLEEGFAGLIVVSSVDKSVTVSLGLTVSISPNDVGPGDEATLTVTVTNSADVPASGVLVAAPLPPGLALVEPVASYRSGAWSAGTVAAGGSVSLSLRVRVSDPGTATLEARVTQSVLPNAGPLPTAAAAVTAATPAAVPEETTPGPAVAARLAGGGWRTVPASVYFGVAIFAVGLMLLLLGRRRPG